MDGATHQSGPFGRNHFMSLQFSDTSTKRGILQEIEMELGFQYGDITGNSTKLNQFTSLVNLAWDNYLTIALPASGTWQFDDSNQTAFPIIKTNIVSGQRDYTFTTDQQGNLILDIYKVAILAGATETLYQEIKPIDAQSDEEGTSLVAEDATGGVPNRYDKTANAIFLDPNPNYAATNGLKVYINREASYFTSSDTTDKPGCPGIHHRYFVLKPAFDFARRNSLSIEASLRNEVLLMEQGIAAYFSRRSRDERFIIEPEIISHD